MEQPPDDGAAVIELPFGDRPTREQRPLRDVIGEVLREERQDQGRTLADVAREAHVSLPYLSEVERGRKEVSSDVLAAICDALELPLVDVLERSADRLRARAQRRVRLQLLAA
jgi:transcriptional regulator with XRE-family HTH domain